MFGSLGIVEISIIAGIAILIFGPSQLPKFGRSIGQTIKEFRGIKRELESTTAEINDDLRDINRKVRS